MATVFPKSWLLYGQKALCMADDRTKYERYDLLVERHRRLIRKLCWRRSSGDENLCDDLVQECYIALWEHFDSLRPEVHAMQETAWVVWQCRSVFSHRKRESEKDLPSVDESHYDYLPAPDASETRELLDGLARTLSLDEQRLFALMRQDLTDLEIAERLGLKPRTIREKQRRIIEKLRQEHLNATKL